MKRLLTTALLALTILGSTRAQTAATPDTQMLALLKEIQVQQATMTENQAKVETRVAALAEAIRVAKIYSSRGGR